MHVWRQALGRVPFVAGMGILVSACWYYQLIPLALILATLGVLILLFNEFDLSGRSLCFAGLASVTGSMLFLLGAVRILTKRMDTTWQQMLKGPIETFVAQVQSMNSSIQISHEDILAQVPSGIVILLFVSLSLALLFEGRLQSIAKILPKQRGTAFLNFKLPDALVWLTILALLLAFLKTEIVEAQQVGTNMLNVIIFLYFLQGMAIVTLFFNHYKLSPVLRTLAYIFIFLQLFVFVSGLGLVDYWVDFRARMLKSIDDKKINGKGGIS